MVLIGLRLPGGSTHEVIDVGSGLACCRFRFCLEYMIWFEMEETDLCGVPQILHIS